MGVFSQRLEGHHIIGLDTSVFIYHLESHPAYVELTRELLDGVQNGYWQAFTSTLTIMELTVRPWQLDRPAVAREYETLLIHFPNLHLVDVTRHVARRAAQLRAQHRIHPADALQVAAVILNQATAFVTNDRRLARLAPYLEIVIMDDFHPLTQ